MQGMVKQRSKSLTKQAYDEIKAAICSNQIKQGDLLSENLIAQELNMSRTPVREALSMLAMEDFVEIKNGVGIYVKMISYQDIRDLFEVRRALEVLSVKTAVHMITEKDISTLEKKFRALLVHGEAGRMPGLREFTDLDWELHELFIDRCRNTYVKNVMRSINANMKRYQYMSAEALDNLQESTQQHLELLELLRKHDVPALQAALDRHIEWSIECFVK